MRLCVGVPLTRPSLLLSDLLDKGTVSRFPTQRVYQETADEINRNTAVLTRAETHRIGNPMCQWKDRGGNQTALSISVSPIKWLPSILTKT